MTSGDKGNSQLEPTPPVRDTDVTFRCLNQHKRKWVLIRVDLPRGPYALGVSSRWAIQRKCTWVAGISSKKAMPCYAFGRLVAPRAEDELRSNNRLQFGCRVETTGKEAFGGQHSGERWLAFTGGRAASFSAKSLRVWVFRIKFRFALNFT
jgi:hypothetical protein